MGASPGRLPDYVAAIQGAWGTGGVTETLAPSMVRSDEARRRWARGERLSATPDRVAIPRAFMESDVTDILSAIQAPTLLISRLGDRHVRPEHSRYLASQISVSKLIELPGEDNFPFAGEADEILDEAQEFITGTRPSPLLDRVLATVLFTDIVGSTATAAQLGDQRWSEFLSMHHEAVRRELERFRGQRGRYRRGRLFGPLRRTRPSDPMWIGYSGHAPESGHRDSRGSPHGRDRQRRG